MASNIKFIGNINDIQRVTRFSLEDIKLLNIEVAPETFGLNNDYIELFVYDVNGNLLNLDYNYRGFKLPSDSYLNSDNTLPIIEIDPVKDIQNLGYISGEFFTQYNFQKPRLSSPDSNDLFISQISDDRTEIRLKSVNISSDNLIISGSQLINELNSSSEQKYFILNSFSNIQFVVINVATDTDDPSILLKLYKPLPLEVTEKTICWVTEEIIEPYAFNLNLDTSVIVSDGPKLRGPNFNIDLDIKQNVDTGYQNYSNLVSSLTGSSYQQILNYMNDNSYDLNIDYTNFSNFVHFSSAKARIDNFYYKVQQIENYNSDINLIVNSTNILKNEQTSSLKTKIDELITNFDGFENYMYFESGSHAWPKSGSNKPYVLLSSTSSNVLAWYNAYTGSAEYYDENNLDYLHYSLPNYIKNDPNNYQPYYKFIDMIGHYFDNVWIYITSINELYNADNNLEKGISKDIVYDALRSLGVKLYNSKGNNDFNDYIDGLNNGDNIFVDSVVTFSSTSSYLNNIPKKDLLAETFKRIYHNIPLLSKTRGTSTGLKNLITTFGVTSSILSPKELGGSNKQNELKGYDNDKITIQNNTITGSVLSPFISLQTSPTASSEFTSTDLHFVDLSFSPQNELNTRLSSSIAALNPTFSIDDYIGDPNLLSSSSYDSLIQQNNYFISASAAVSGSEQRLDYKGFIDLIKYFDNSLFKMLKDFVPARTNALTGITIKSSILERNKIPVYNPKVENNTVYEAEYAAPTITEDKSYYYDKLKGNKDSFYNGQLTGSYLNVYSYFDDKHVNPYLHPSNSIDLNIFNHSEFNAVLNNVSSSVLSSVRRKLETNYVVSNDKVFLGGTDIVSNVELQDSNLTLKGHKNSRYDGTKLSSLTYNTYNSSSATYDGDISYGKTAAIDHNTKKIGLFTQIQTNQFLLATEKNNVALKYLVDESGSLIELNKKNKHWAELQNTFKTGDTLTVALFDNQKYSNQKRTDGIKYIYNSGYSYTPVLYCTGSFNKLYFNYTSINTPKLFNAQNIVAVSPGPTGYINGGVGYNNYYGLKPSGSSGGKVIYNVFDSVVSNDGNSFSIGHSTTNTYPSYSVNSSGNYTFTSLIDINYDLKAAQRTISFNYNIIKGGIDSNGHPTGSILGTTGLKSATSYYAVHQSNKGDIISAAPSFSSTVTSYPISSATYDNLGLFNGSTKLKNFTWSGTINTFTDTLGGGTWYLYSITYTFDAGGYFPTFTKLMISNNGSLGGTSPTTLTSNDYILTETTTSDFSSNQTGILTLDLTTSGSVLSAGDKVYFKLSLESSTDSNFTASFSSAGNLQNGLVSNISGNNVYATGSSVDHFISGAINTVNSGIYDTIVLNNSLSAVYGSGYSFIPNSGSADVISLYNKYGDVNDSFVISQGDVIVMFWSNQIYESIVKSVDTSSNIKITFTNELPSGLITQLNSPSLSNAGLNQFIVLKKNNDETSLLLQFNKNPGNTSLGFIIPSNIHPDVLNNIDVITKEVKQKLIDLGMADGGSF